MLRLVVVWLALLWVGLAQPASAMDFRILQASDGQRVVVATGVIRAGDVLRFTAALKLATPGRNGTRQLLLNSPGGNVGQALLMSEVMDQVGVSTVVPAGAFCASACASILFVSGKYRTIEKGGVIAIHSCSDTLTGKQAAICNLLISAHAQYEGVPGIGMMALQQVAGTHNLFVFDAAGAACFGLTRKPGARGKVTAPCVDAAMKQARASQRGR